MKSKKLFLSTLAVVTLSAFQVSNAESNYFQCNVDMNSVTVQAAKGVCGVTFKTLPAVSGGNETWIDSTSFTILDNPNPTVQDCEQVVNSDNFLSAIDMDYDGVSLLCMYKGSNADGNKFLLAYLDTQSEGISPFGGQLEIYSNNKWTADTAQQCSGGGNVCRVEIDQ